MVDPITIVGPCADVNASMISYWDCFTYVVFMNDAVLMALAFLLFIAIMGFTFRLPITVMAVLGFGMVLGLFYLTRAPFLIIVILAGVILLGFFTLMALFRGGKLATD